MVEMNENYNDKTTLDEYYPIIKENIRRLADVENTLESSIEALESDTAALKAGRTIEDYAIKSRHLGTDSVTTSKIHDLNVTTSKLADNAVTKSKLDPNIFASIAETRAGMSSSQAVTPYTLKHGLDELIPASVISGDFSIENLACSDINEDVISIFHNPIKDENALHELPTATVSEVVAGTAADKAVTPATLTAFKTANRIDAWADAFTPGSRMYDVLGYASLTEMAEDLKPLHKYSTTPQQIGAWIDGTPVWRVAFNTPLSAQDLEDKAFWTISALGLVNDLDAVTLILGGTAALYMGTIVDNQTTSLDANGVFTWSNSVNPDANAIAGYIEFVTPASNIRS